MDFLQSRQARSTLLFLISFIFLSAATYAVFQKSGEPLVGVDDANINFVYSENLLTQGAFVYNEGGERVEGFTAMLWIVLGAAAFAFFANPELALLVLNVALVSVALGYLALVVSTSMAPPRLRFVSIALLFLWVFSNQSYISWATISLMEFGLWSALQIVLVAMLLRSAYAKLSWKEHILFASLIVLLVIARPEAFLLGGLYSVLLVITSYIRGDGPRKAVHSALPSFLAYAASALAITLFRILYFGFPLPNTYYAKVSTDLLYTLSSGFQYFVQFVSWYPLVFIPLLGLGYVGYLLSSQSTGEGSHRSLAQYVTLVAVLSVSLLIPIWEGGDYFPEARFFLPVWPLMALPMILLLSIVHRAGARKVLISFTIAASLAFCFFSPYGWHEWSPEFYREQNTHLIEKDIRIAHLERERGSIMNEFFTGYKPLPTVAVIAAGGFALTYDGPITDMLGLNSVVMAHQNRSDRRGLTGHAAFDKETFFTMPADILLPLLSTDGSTSLKELEADSAQVGVSMLKGLFTDEEFRRRFEPAVVFSHSTGQYLFGYWSRPFLARVARDDGFTIVSEGWSR